MASSPPIAGMPTELIVFVLENLDRLRDLSSLAQTNRKLYSTVNPILYERAVSQGDAWPLAWAAHCGVVGTLRMALAAGADPHHQFMDGLAIDEWKRSNTAARQAVAEDEENELWETDNEGESNLEWSPEAETEDSTHPATIDLFDPPSDADPPGMWVPFFTDSDQDSDISMDEVMEEEESTEPSDAASSTLDEHDHSRFSDPYMPNMVLRRFNPLHLAARGGHNDIIEVLLDHGAPINCFSECFCECTRLYGLLNAAECPQTDDFPPSWSALHVAICHSRSDTAKLLLSRGASYMMEQPTDYAETPYLDHNATALHHAAAHGLADLVKYLLDKGIQAVVDVRDDKTLTPFYHAYAGRRWDSTVPLLLELGANINVDTKLFLPYSTITPLGEACRMGNFEDADRLIDLGADVTRGYVATGSGRGLSPLHMISMPSAQHVGDIAVPRVFEEEGGGARRMRTIEKLIAKGAVVSAKDCSGDTPLIAAAQHQNVPALKALIKAGADIHQRNAVGRNALMQAIMGPPMPVTGVQYKTEALGQTLRELLNGGARLEEVDSEGNTVLHLVFKRGDKFHFRQVEALRLLLNKPGACLLFQVRNIDKQTPLLLAFKARNLEACETLVRRGCLRGALEREELLSMFEEAIVNIGEPDSLDFVLDLDVDGHLTSDHSVFSTLITKGGFFALHAAKIISQRGLPRLSPSDTTRLLSKAVRLGELCLAYALIDHGADVNAQNEDGHSPLAILIKNAFLQRMISMKTSGAHQFLQALLDRGADHHLQFASGSPERILNRVIALELEDALSMMLEKRPLSGDAQAANGFYLHGAVTIVAGQRPSASSEKIIEILLSSGPDLGEVNNDGDTPLYHRFIKALAGPDVDINRQNNEGRSIADYLEELMLPRDGGPGQTTFLTRRIQLVDVEGGKALKFLPRPHKRVRPSSVFGARSSTEDVAIGASTTLESETGNRVSRRSGSHTDPKRPVPPPDSTEEKPHLSAEPDPSRGHGTLSTQSTVLFTPAQDSFDAIERGLGALRHEKKAEDTRQRLFSISGRSRRATAWEATKWTLRALAGQNEALRNWLVVIASCLGIVIAVSGIFGWPALPVLRKNADGTVVPIFQLPSDSTHTTVSNFYYCTFIHNEMGMEDVPELV
ncbi:ankyrin repeat-containing domain protein [Lasiosphaeria ovina]|uniref:Ankyrin repeat-containing domain protein n=1 Tax=Lasiosphaeria ovina TaxID=92902 RepID=A0AAE0MY46_9PEZI|nr:ankyrin repeat-containing domain protein [Lasiosphaeria ovina]